MSTCLWLLVHVFNLDKFGRRTMSQRDSWAWQGQQAQIQIKSNGIGFFNLLFYLFILIFFRVGKMVCSIHHCSLQYFIIDSFEVEQNKMLRAWTPCSLSGACFAWRDNKILALVNEVHGPIVGSPQTILVVGFDWVRSHLFSNCKSCMMTF